MPTALIIHGHFYQPPRENPWTETVDREPSAAPFHDWNERIYRECYRANAYARIVDQYNRVESIINNYENISFNFGPTLLSWMETHHKRSYERILEADRESVRMRGGHGNAIAQGYNHMILPLATERDRRTQIRWGVEDFRFRFKRDPESLWLPETACNNATLDALIDEGLRYVILSPVQAERVRPIGGGEWRDVSDCSIDPSQPYAYFHSDGSKRSIAIFFYDGPIARAIAFEGGLASSRALVERFAMAAQGEGRAVNVATDGESYGHHFRWGDRGLAYALEVEAPQRGFWVTNYGEFLEHHTPAWEVEIKLGPNGEGTAWSCAHGVGRWIRDCGCHTGASEGWNQAWRGPVRLALDTLGEEAARIFAETEGDLFRDPWAARDDYIKLVVSHHRFREEFLYRHAGRLLRTEEKARALTFLEMQRHAMLMYTSCGWFFADVSGIETVQDLKYAGRVLDFFDELGLPSPEKRFLEILAEARSNSPEHGTGADIYRNYVGQSRVTAAAVASNQAIYALVDHQKSGGETAGYRFRLEDFHRRQHGRLKLATGRLHLESLATARAFDYAFAAMHFGGVDFYCVIKPYPGDKEFKASTEKLWASFRTASLARILRLAQEEFGAYEFGLEHVLPEGREKIAEIVFRNLVKRFAEDYASLYNENRRRIRMLQSAGFELPAELRAAAEFTLGKRFEDEIRKQQQSKDPAAYQRAIKIAEEVARRGYRIDRTASRRMFEEMIAGSVHLAIEDPTAENVQAALSLCSLNEKLGIEASLDRAQEEIYDALADRRRTAAEIGELALKVGIAPSVVERARPVEPEKSRTTDEEAIVS